MSEVKTFFRHCPSCGRRFEIRLVSKRLMGSEEHFKEEKAVAPVSPQAPLLLTDDCPCIVDVKEFQYTYRCKHCGHEWSEVRERDEAGRGPGSYTGD
jgi:predicted RNA-binding Zn-ribbon protein involved in translation (DUF1610 family)